MPYSPPDAPPPCIRVPSGRTSYIIWLDELLSALITSMPLGLTLESLVLLIPGHMFGAPLCTLCLLPCTMPFLVGSISAHGPDLIGHIAWLPVV